MKFTIHLEIILKADERYEGQGRSFRADLRQFKRDPDAEAARIACLVLKEMKENFYSEKEFEIVKITYNLKNNITRLVKEKFLSQYP